MEYGNIFEISATGMDFQRLRMETIAANIANANSTYSNTTGVYRPLAVVSSFETLLEGVSNIRGVQSMDVIEKDIAPRRTHNPDHPDADAEGYVYSPNINLLEEMTSLMTATRGYEANVSVINAGKAMALKALEIGR